jgi:hypothetical protein
MRLFSSDENVECAVPDAKFDEAESSPSIHEKFDEVSWGLERGESCEDGVTRTGLEAFGGVVGRGLGVEEVFGLVIEAGAGSEGGSIEIGGALDVRSGSTGVCGAGNASVSAAFTLAACSVVSSLGSGIDVSSR